MSCKDGQCGIRGRNTTRAQRPKFNVGEIIYVNIVTKRINGETVRTIYRRNKVLVIGIFMNEYVYTLDKYDEKVFERHIIPFAYVQAQLKINPIPCIVE